MTTQTISIWTHDGRGVADAQQALAEAFGANAAPQEPVKSLVWHNSGPQHEDTRIGYQPALASDRDNPTLRHIMQIAVSGTEAEISAGIGRMSELLEKRYPDLVVSGAGLALGKARFKVVEGAAAEEKPASEIDETERGHRAALG